MTKKTLLVLLIVLSGSMVVNAQVTVSGAHASSNGTYAKLSLAFTAINGQSQTGNNIVVTITSSPTVETGSATLNAGAWTTLKIYPTASGLSISSAVNYPLINLNGADNVTIDGRVNAIGLTPDLTISNASTAADNNTSTIRFYNDASNNTVQYCVLKGSTTNTTYGILLFSNTTVSVGNSYNTIDHNQITNAGGNRPPNAIYSNGTSSVPNRNNTISNNNMYDVLNGTIGNTCCYINLSSSVDNIGYNTEWTITGNSFYETSTTYPAGGSSINLIYIYAWDNTFNGNNFTITNNYIGGNAPLCGGTWTKSAGNNMFYFMQLRVGTGTYSNIQGNTIKNINFTNSSYYYCYGIDVQKGDVNIGTTAGNCFGASEGTGSIVFTANGSNSQWMAIHIQDIHHVYIQNNIIGSVTTANNNSANATNLYGIYLNADGGTYSVSNNTIGSTSTANSLNATSTSTTDPQRVCGVYIEGNSGTMSINTNTIVNLKNGTTNGTTTTYGSIYGIYVYRCTNTISGNTIHDLNIANANTGAGQDWGNNITNSISAAGIAFTTNSNTAQTITGNTIYNISNTRSDFAGHIAGIYYCGQPTASTVSGNLIYDLSVHSSSTSASIHGIKIANGVATYSNNIITLGGNTTTNLYGIYDGNASGTSNIYFNSVYLNGSPTSGSLTSAGLYNSTTADTRNYRNNIFFNARSNSGASGKHYAMYIQNTGGSLTCDYNDYWVTGTDGTLGYYGGDKTSIPIVTGVTGNDAHSQNLNPLFANAGGTNAGDYIPSTALPAATSTGILTDYGGSTRSASSPEMGAWEKKNELTWTGVTSTDWSVPGNWDLGSVPLASSNVTIPASPTNQPRITQTVASPAACNNLTIQLDAELGTLPI